MTGVQQRLYALREKGRELPSSMGIAFRRLVDQAYMNQGSDLIEAAQAAGRAEMRRQECAAHFESVADSLEMILEAVLQLNLESPPSDGSS